MAEILKLVYVIITFISLFLIATKTEGVHFRCFRDSDCVKLYCRPPLKSKCMYKTNCKCIAVYTQEDYGLT
ncbi:putative Late nodulin [Medicago truncatula]|uniref:Nodule Cysteine-Rich (NCR) secreted peptide n=1 Tax=Medicago truncatula TaxID=3880 RepID=A0A072TQJ0_MEDTR|nr:Nodule Cysteine-Rich (NCR) secreted peptide [Medicago truncatula]RHN41071.1 putative Late nodulin [Medicago truncatula]